MAFRWLSGLGTDEGNHRIIMRLTERTGDKSTFRATGARIDARYTVGATGMPEQGDALCRIVLP
ncbi:hypothetical protein C2W62_01365 [Candidatus Entotheonella serta]|nr:hypothetical protein C2W62_01365 [Candidatus Entotheonella serta]